MVPHFHVGRILGHRVAGVTGVYARWDYWPEKLKALSPDLEIGLQKADYVLLVKATQARLGEAPARAGIPGRCGARGPKAICREGS